MEQFISELSFRTESEGFTNLTSDVNNWIKQKNLSKGILIISIKHTSCSLIINENADPRVLIDLSNFMRALVPEYSFKSSNSSDEAIYYQHNDEGSDDMPAHIRTALTCTSLSLSINKQHLTLGTWQAIYLWEHRNLGQTRTITIHAIGETT